MEGVGDGINSCQNFSKEAIMLVILKLFLQKTLLLEIATPRTDFCKST